MRSRANAAASRYARRIIAAEPTAFSQRDVLSTTPAAILKPSSERTDRICESAVEHDLSGGERARAELVLELADREAVGPAVDRARHEEAADAARALGSALRPRGDGELVGVRHRAEPLLPVQPPGVAVPHCTREVRADVGAAVLLGEELRAALAAFVVRLQERR